MSAFATKGLLNVVKTLGGKLIGRVRLQKLVHLLRFVGIEDFRKLRFRYHFHGPYSRQLSEVVREAVAEGLLNEKQFDGDEGRFSYSYELTKDGQNFLGDLAFEPGEELAQELEFVNKLNSRSLELEETARKVVAKVLTWKRKLSDKGVS